MATGQPVLYQDFRGGVNLQSGPYLLEESQCRDARNVHSTTIGSIRKREGMVTLSDETALATLDGPAHTLFPVNLSTKSLLAVGKQASASNDRIVKLSTSGVATTLKSGLTQGKRWEFVQGPLATDETPDQGPIYGINGFDTPQYWDGSASATVNWVASLGTVPINCTLLIYHLDKFWAAGDPAHPGRVQSTGLNNDATPLPDPCNWDTDFIDEVDPNDGEAITGLGKIGPYLLVFKPHKTYVLSDPVGRAYRPVSSTIGCSAHRSIVETSRGTMFLSEDMGVCVTDGTDVTPISDNILPLLREAANVNAANFYKASATYFRDSYWLSIPTEDSENDLMLEYQLQEESWWIHTCTSNQFALLDPGGTPKLYSANAQDKRVEQAFVEGTFTDNLATYPEVYWQGPFWPFGQPHLNKRISQFRADGLGDWTMSAATAFSDDYEVLDELTWEGTDSFVFGGDGIFGGVSDVFAPPAGISERRYFTPTQGWGRAWSIRIDNADDNEMELYAVTAFTRPRAD